MSLLGALQIGHGCEWLPKRLFVVQAYSHVLRMADVAHGLQVEVTVCKLSIALLMAGCRTCDTKNRFQRCCSSLLRSCLCICGSSVAVSCFWMCACCVICCSSDCVACTASRRLSSIELSIQCCSGGSSSVSSCV